MILRDEQITERVDVGPCYGRGVSITVNESGAACTASLDERQVEHLIEVLREALT